MSTAIRFGNKLRELRIHLCQTSPASAGVRDFIHNNYVTLKKAHPNIPILIRECKGVQARVWARYEKGVESSAPLEKLSSNEVSNTIKKISQ